MTKKALVENFAKGQSVTSLAAMTGKKRSQIEDVIREWIILESSANRLRTAINKEAKR